MPEDQFGTYLVEGPLLSRLQKLDDPPERLNNRQIELDSRQHSILCLFKILDHSNTILLAAITCSILCPIVYFSQTLSSGFRLQSLWSSLPLN